MNVEKLDEVSGRRGSICQLCNLLTVSNFLSNETEQDRHGRFFVVNLFIFYGVMELFLFHSILTLNQFTTNAFVGFSDVILFNINELSNTSHSVDYISQVWATW